MTRKLVGLHILAFVYMVPMSINLSSYADKPIDVSVSFIALLFAVFLLMCGATIDRRSFTAVVVLAYFPVLGIFSSIVSGGNINPILSSVNFFIPCMHLLAGSVLLKSTDVDIGVVFARTLAAIVLILVLSDVVFGEFPRGCGYEGRWGGCLGPFPVYGFPNASMGLLAALSPIMILLLGRGPKNSFVATLTMALILLLSILSLSRSATLIAGLSAMVFVVCWLGYLRALVCILLLAALGGVNWSKMAEWPIVHGIYARLEHSILAGDVTTGRIGIWSQALDVFWQSPIFGSGFAFFSDISSYGSAHQQYLEVLYKSGLVGFVIYFGCFAYIIGNAASEVRRHGSSREKLLVLFLVVFFVSISSVFQSALTYQVLGGLSFFMGGYFLARRNVQR